MLSKRGQVRTNDLFIGFLTLSLPPPIPTHPRTRSRPETAHFCNNTCPYGSLLANMGRGLSRYSGASDAPDFGHRTPAFVAPFSSPSPVGPYLQGPQGRSGNCPACACIKRRTAGSVPKLCGGRTVTEQGPVRHAGHHTCYGRALLPCGVRCTRTSPPSPPPPPRRPDCSCPLVCCRVVLPSPGYRSQGLLATPRPCTRTVAVFLESPGSRS